MLARAVYRATLRGVHQIKSGHPLQLSPPVTSDRSRHWVIADEDGAEDEVVPKGSHGVVGQTPTLAPGAEFQYASGTELRGPKGAIRGSFESVSVGDGSTFEAEVRPFALVAPPAPGGAR
ncbi:hypothetical protein JL721_12490 [Aureococcus anophagefferens]|nr:hypothetical protein JL721_12490 [Aureococcus anophagefferens]